MHAGFPQLSSGIFRTLNSGMQGDAHLKSVLSQAGGGMVAGGMALALRLGFSLILRDGLLDETQSRRAKIFFEDNFKISDPMVTGGIRYYQGKFMIRTRQAGDNMNVLLEFCPSPGNLYRNMPWGACLDPFSVVQTSLLDEEEADVKVRCVDLVIQFRDSATILGLIGQANVDIVGLLLKNQVQLTGNVGHLFKLGAIAADVQRLIASVP